jgi:hypothetical protein
VQYGFAVVKISSADLGGSCAIELPYVQIPRRAGPASAGANQLPRSAVESVCKNCHDMPFKFAYYAG